MLARQGGVVLDVPLARGDIRHNNKCKLHHTQQGELLVKYISYLGISGLREGLQRCQVD